MAYLPTNVVVQQVFRVGGTLSAPTREYRFDFPVPNADAVEVHVSPEPLPAGEMATATTFGDDPVRSLLYEVSLYPDRPGGIVRFLPATSTFVPFLLVPDHVVRVSRNSALENPTAFGTGGYASARDSGREAAANHRILQEVLLQLRDHNQVFINARAGGITLDYVSEGFRQVVEGSADASRAEIRGGQLVLRDNADPPNEYSLPLPSGGGGTGGLSETDIKAFARAVGLTDSRDIDRHDLSSTFRDELNMIEARIAEADSQLEIVFSEITVVGGVTVTVEGATGADNINEWIQIGTGAFPDHDSSRLVTLSITEVTDGWVATDSGTVQEYEQDSPVRGIVGQATGGLGTLIEPPRDALDPQGRRSSVRMHVSMTADPARNVLFAASEAGTFTIEMRSLEADATGHIRFDAPADLPSGFLQVSTPDVGGNPTLRVAAPAGGGGSGVSSDTAGNGLGFAAGPPAELFVRPFSSAGMIGSDTIDVSADGVKVADDSIGTDQIADEFDDHINALISADEATRFRDTLVDQSNLADSNAVGMLTWTLPSGTTWQVSEIDPMGADNGGLEISFIKSPSTVVTTTELEELQNYYVRVNDGRYHIGSYEADRVPASNPTTVDVDIGVSGVTFPMRFAIGEPIGQDNYAPEARPTADRTLEAGMRLRGFLREGTMPGDDPDWSDVPTASMVAKGVVELANQAEATGGTDNMRAMTSQRTRQAIDGRVEDWARDDSTLIPANKLTNAGTSASWILEGVRSGNVSYTLPAAADWGQWQSMSVTPAASSTQVGRAVLSAGVNVQATDSPTGGGSRLLYEARIRRTRASVDTVVRQKVGYIRNVYGATGYSTNFRDASQIGEDSVSAVVNVQAGDVFTLDVRAMSQNSFTEALSFGSNNGDNTLSIAGVGGLSGPQGIQGPAGQNIISVVGVEMNRVDAPGTNVDTSTFPSGSRSYKLREVGATSDFTRTRTERGEFHYQIVMRLTEPLITTHSEFSFDSAAVTRDLTLNGIVFLSQVFMDTTPFVGTTTDGRQGVEIARASIYDSGTEQGRIIFYQTFTDETGADETFGITTEWVRISGAGTSRRMDGRHPHVLHAKRCSIRDGFDGPPRGPCF